MGISVLPLYTAAAVSDQSNSHKLPMHPMLYHVAQVEDFKRNHLHILIVKKARHAAKP